MKNYFAIESQKRVGGYLYLHIYRTKSTGMEYIGMARYQPQSTRGAESEVMEALANAGEIPKKYAKPSLYFEQERPCNIRIIDPCYLDDCIKLRKEKFLFN